MYLRQIKYFLALVDHGSFRKAAETLSISQPALSNSIKTLEAHYGVKLVERSSLGVRPTAFGTALYGFLSSAMQSIERGSKEVELISRGAGGHLRIGAPTGLIDQLVPEVITELCSASRGIHVAVRYGYLDALLPALYSSELDVLVTTYWPEANLTADLVIEKFADLSISIYCRREHPLARKRTITLADLARAAWILPESTGMRTFLTEVFGIEGRSAIERPISHDYPPFMARMITQMDLLSLIPDYTVAEHVRSGALRRLEYAPFRPTLSAGVIYQRDRHQTAALKAFIRIAAERGARRYAAAAGTPSGALARRPS